MTENLINELKDEVGRMADEVEAKRSDEYEPNEIVEEVCVDIVKINMMQEMCPGEEFIDRNYLIQLNESKVPFI